MISCKVHVQVKESEIMFPECSLKVAMQVFYNVLESRTAGDSCGPVYVLLQTTEN